MDRKDDGLPSGTLDFIRASLGEGATLVRLAGDASTRQFYRVSGPRDTAILMVQETPIEADSGQHTNHRVLTRIGAPVPRVIARGDRLGLLLFEDFGDLSLQQLATRGGPGDREASRDLYLQACALIERLQTAGTAALLPGDFASRNALDRERFLFELDHFDRHFIRGLRRLTPTPDETSLLQRFYQDLAAGCDVLPRVYCHRDFQSRNLMVRQGRLCLIDFQDARMGPYTYDAASLLRDSSLDLQEDLVEELLHRLEETCAVPLAIGREEFRRDFDLMALQRNIKDLGTFGYMATVRGRMEYLDYVPRTQASIARTLVASRRYHDIYAVFRKLALD
jgi:aminoglycoside/choline kinase family phosphotransferase